MFRSCVCSGFEAFHPHRHAVAHVVFSAPFRYERVLELQPGAVQPRMELGVVLARLGDHARARDVWEEAVRLQPDMQAVVARLTSHTDL